MDLTQFPLVVIGDLHGRRDLLCKALLAFGLADEAGRWTGGERRLIQLGDLVDRGPEPLALLDLMINLQAEARAAGGEVTCLLGNHEAMALRAGAGCHAGRLQWALNGGGSAYREWLARTGQPPADERPPYAEGFYALFAPTGPYGRWLRSHQLATWAGEYVVVHAGWDADSPASVAEANQLYADPALDPLRAIHEPEHLLGSKSALTWARHQPEAEIAAACERLGCRGLIAGHTIQHGIRITAGGRLLQIDAGMYAHGTWVALGLTAAGEPWAVIEGQAPVPVAGDAFYPLQPAAAGSKRSPQPPRYHPGQLVELYRAAGGDWVQYYYIRRLDEVSGVPYYLGDWVTQTAGRWSLDERQRPAAWIDQFARPVDLATVTGLSAELRAALTAG